MEQLPKAALRERFGQYVSRWTMKDGTQVTVRPICLEDEPLMVKFHESLSDRSVHLRYFYSFSLNARTAPDRLLRICLIDYDREMAMVAEHEDPNSETREILGVGRLTKLQRKNEAEVAVLVTDRYQHLGLGAELLPRLIQVARDRNLDRLVAEILQENLPMQTLARRLGFRRVASDDPAVLKAILDL